VQRRWKEGCRNAALLFREIKEQGYRVGKTTVKDYVSYLRRYASEADLSHSRSLRKERATSISPREMRWLLARQKEDLNEEQQAKLQRLLETSTDVQQVHALLQNFHIMVKQKREEMLDCWLEQAERSGIIEMRSFAYGVRRDYSAVKAAIVLPWSQGQTEGQVNKLKTLKRAMYGRAGFALLRQRLLAGCGATS
jgi:transposase